MAVAITVANQIEKREYATNFFERIELHLIGALNSNSPTILLGPILRRAEAKQVCIWVACNLPISAKAEVFRFSELEISRKSKGAKPSPIGVGTTKMILLGSLNIVTGPFILMTDIDDKLKAGVKAIVNKTDKAYRDLKTDYQREKYETEGHVESKSEIGRDLERVGDKLEAGARAVANKTDDAYRDLRTEYHKEKTKEKLD